MCINDDDEYEELNPYIDNSDTKGLIKEYIYRERSGFFKRFPLGRFYSSWGIIKSLFIR